VAQPAGNAFYHPGTWVVGWIDTITPSESRGSESSIMVRRALSRVSPLFIIYHSQASDGRDLGGNRPRSEQTLPLKAIWLYAFSALCYSPDCSYSILIYAPSAWCEPRPPAPAGKTRRNHHPPLGTTRWIKAQGWASAPHWVGQRVRAICTPPGDRRVAFPTSCRAQSQLPPNR